MSHIGFEQNKSLFSWFSIVKAELLKREKVTLYLYIVECYFAS